MNKIILAILAAFTLSLFSANAVGIAPHAGEQMLAKHESGKSHHGKKSGNKSGKKSKKHKKHHHKKG